MTGPQTDTIPGEALMRVVRAAIAVRSRDMSRATESTVNVYNEFCQAIDGLALAGAAAALKEDATLLPKEAAGLGYVVFWHFDIRSVGGFHCETYEDLAEAKETLANYRRSYPKTNYRLAQIIDPDPPGDG